MTREISAVLRPDGTATLTGIALVPRAPFTGTAFDRMVAKLQERAATKMLFVTFSDGGLPATHSVRLQDVCGTVEEVRVTDDGARIVVQLHQTPMGSLVYRLLRARAQEDPPRSSGLAFTTLALGRTSQDGVAEDAVPVGVFLISADLFAEE